MWSFMKLGLYTIFWSILWFIVIPFRKGRHNCLTWAVEKWDQDGGYLVVRWCRTNSHPFLRWPHFMWMDEKHHRNLEHLVPKKSEECHVLPKAWFDGRHVRGDSLSTDKPEN